MDRDRGRDRRKWFALCAALTACLLVACGPSDPPPPTNPLAETPSASTSVPAGPPTTPGPGGPGSGGAAESAAATAISLMAEWLGIEESTLRVVAVESVDWPDTCLGVTTPGALCAEVITPGWRVLLIDGLDGAHTVHMSLTGDARWSGEATASGLVTAVEPSSGAVELQVDGQPLALRTAPGSSLGGPFEVGAPVRVAYDTAPTEDSPPVIAWIAPEPPV